jgi:predicted Zn-dependent protease
LAVLLWVIFAGLVVYYVETRYVPCEKPIAYRIGTVDPGFGVSKEQFASTIKTAAQLWSKEAGKTLFESSNTGALTINLVYDERQKITQEANALTSNIKADKATASTLKQQYAALEAQYDAALDAYNSKLTAYNSKVEYYNSHGGAPRSEYAALQQTKTELQNERIHLQDLAAQIKALVDQYNNLVDDINQNVDIVNNNGLTGTEFEEGVYISDKEGQRINIYQFDNQAYFTRVVAHELGHALGLAHVSGKTSIMNPVNQSQTIALSSEDKAALTALCRL